MTAITQPRAFPAKVALLLLAGAAVAVALGVYGRVHTPVGQQSTTMFVFSVDFAGKGMLTFKSWFTTIAIAFAVLQLVSALRLYDRISFPKQIPLWLGDAHRLFGTLALLASLPVAFHCLWSLGFRTTDARVLAHSVLGCFFYGAFVTKVLSVRSHDTPGWLLPLMGGTTFAVLSGVWLTSAAFFFTGRIG